MKNKALYLFSALLVVSVVACKNKSTMSTQETSTVKEATTAGPVTYKGLYSFSPDVKSFKECGHPHEYWVADSSAQLELQYSQLNLKPEEAVYVEVAGRKIRSVKDGPGGGFDTTLVVTKLIKITKDLPKTDCN